MQTKTTFGKNFLIWFIIDEPYAIVRGYTRYAQALLEIVPFGFLLLTLLAPWKNLEDKTREHGFNLNRWIERLFYSLLSRGVGFTVRLVTIILGMLFHLILLSFATLYLALWVGFPVWAILALYSALNTL